MGRPTDNPKPIQISVRFDIETSKILDSYCTENNVSRVDGIREGVKRLEKE